MLLFIVLLLIPVSFAQISEYNLDFTISLKKVYVVQEIEFDKEREFNINIPTDVKEQEIIVDQIIKNQTTNTQTNNRLLNLTPLDFNDVKTVESLTNIANEFYNRDYFNEGQKGVAKFVTDKFLTDLDGNPRYICTDVSRQAFKHKSASGDVIKDLKAVKLSKLLEMTVVPISADIMKELLLNCDPDQFKFISDNFMSIKGIAGNNNDDFRSMLAGLTS